MKAIRLERRLSCACSLGMALLAATHHEAAGQPPFDDRPLPNLDSVREERNITDPLQALQWERVDALREVVEEYTIKFEAGEISLEDLTPAIAKLTAAELEVASL